MFALLGYELTNSRRLVDRFEKIALFSLDSKPKHAARQDRATGQWLSKLGDKYDISNEVLEDVEGEEYGSVDSTYRRPIDHGLNLEIELQCVVHSCKFSEAVQLGSIPDSVRSPILAPKTA